MKTINRVLAVSLITALCIPAGAQAFCFLKNKNSNNRAYSTYNFPPPAVSYRPAYAYPRSAALPGGQNAGHYPGYPAGLQGAGLYRGARDWQ